MNRKRENDLRQPTDAQQLKEVAIYLEGILQGQGELSPLGTAHLDNLWRILHVMNHTTRLDQPDENERLEAFDVIRTPGTADSKPGAWVKFDLNKYVRFKRGPMAEKAINTYFDGNPRVRIAQPDSEGYLIMQLHVALAIFGPFVDGGMLANEFYVDFNSLGK